MEQTKVKGLSDDALFEAFGDAVTIFARKEVLTELIVRKLIPKQAENPNFNRGWQALLSQAATISIDPRERLLALAEAVRAVQAMRVLKRWQKNLITGLIVVFAEPLPPLELLGDADDRLNVARACSMGEAPWLREYVAQSIASEDKGKNACQELMNCLAGLCSSLSEMMLILATSFSQVQIATEEKGETLSRRLVQSMLAFRSVVLESELEAGPELGYAFEKWIVTTLKYGGIPKTDKAKIDYIRETLLTLHDLVRTRFSISTDPNTYIVLPFLRRLNGNWPSEVERELGLLIKDISEALVLIGRQGVIDPSLLEQLRALCNYPERAKAIAKDLAAKHSELSEEVRDWLIEGRVRQRINSDTAQEEVARHADASIGFALIEAKKAYGASRAIKDEIISMLDLYEPNLLSATQTCFTVYAALVVQVENAALQRSLSLFGNVGEAVEASLKFFDWIGNPSGQIGVVQRPAIVRMRADGSVGDVVIKGLIGS
jgi:hypothetical protein